ncbi:MAG: hypothetical protein AAB874_00490, partial [Patescibacteria group bacterium]
IIIYSWNEITRLKLENGDLQKGKDLLSSRIDELTQQNIKLNLESEKIKKQEDAAKLEEKKKNDIKMWPISGIWQSSQFDYSLSNAYLSPKILDIEESVDKANLQGKEFIVIEAKVTDKRTQGARRTVPLADFLSLTAGKETINATSTSVNYLEPGGNTVVYATFAVPKGETQYTVAVGPTSSKQKLTLDTLDLKLQVLQGTMSFQTGFSASTSN